MIMYDTEGGSLIVKGCVIAPWWLSAAYPEDSSHCQCTSTCCEGRVYVDLRERDTVLVQKEIIKASIDGSQTTFDRFWFEEEEHSDPEYATGSCVGTREANNKCVFLAALRRRTSQTAAGKAGTNRRGLKPLVRIPYPIEIRNGRVGFDSMLQDERPCSTMNPTFYTPLFLACRVELTHLLGPDGYHAIEQHDVSLQSHQSVR